jgi:hypothetical protein
MSQPKDDARFLHGRLDPKAVFDRGGERLLAQNVVPLCGEGHDELRVHVVVDGDEDGVRESLSATGGGGGRLLVKAFPGVEREAGVDAESIREERTCLRSRLGDGDHLASGRV